MTRKELASELGVSVGWLSQQIAVGRFPKPIIPRKRNALWLFDEVRDYLRAGRPDIRKWNSEHWVARR